MNKKAAGKDKIDIRGSELVKAALKCKKNCAAAMVFDKYNKI